jgi:hypothetical protein
VERVHAVGSAAAVGLVKSPSRRAADLGASAAAVPSPRVAGFLGKARVAGEHSTSRPFLHNPRAGLFPRPMS